MTTTEDTTAQQPPDPGADDHRTVWQAALRQPALADGFTNEEDLVRHVEAVTGATPTTATSISGSMSRRGNYMRLDPDSVAGHTTRDPVLDSMLGPLGDLRVGPVSTLPASRPTATALPAEYCTSLGGGVTRCASPDRSTVEYRVDGVGTVTFHAFKHSKLFMYKSIGAEISTTGRDFDAARIDSVYYDVAYGQTAAAVKVDHDEDRNDDYLDEYEWSVNASPPIGVQSLCRVQFGGHRFRDIVTTGLSGHLVVGDVPTFPAGFPDDWPPEHQPATITVAPKSLNVRGITPRPLTRTVTVENTYPDTRRVRVSDVHASTTAAARAFSVRPTSATVGANEETHLQVTFNPQALPAGPAGTRGPVTASFSVRDEHDRSIGTVQLRGLVVPRDIFA